MTEQKIRKNWSIVTGHLNLQTSAPFSSDGAYKPDEVRKLSNPDKNPVCAMSRQQKPMLSGSKKRENLREIIILFLHITQMENRFHNDFKRQCGDVNRTHGPTRETARDIRANPPPGT